VARDGAGVVLLGPPGCGKSDLALRLLECGFVLVADDRIDIMDGIARPPASLAGLLEVRGLGILRLPHATAASLVLAVSLTETQERLPTPRRDPNLHLPLIAVDPRAPSAPLLVARALDCLEGRIGQIAGAFTS
jgi:HPr kinase/phosphorylase